MWQATDINSDSEYMICSPVILSRTEAFMSGTEVPSRTEVVPCKYRIVPIRASRYCRG